MLLRLPGTVRLMAAVVAVAIQSLVTAAAQTTLVPAQEEASLLGGERAQGAVIWSHGRSLQTECSLAPTPEYIGVFRAAGWDTFSPESAADRRHAGGERRGAGRRGEALKHRGYRRVVLAGSPSAPSFH